MPELDYLEIRVPQENVNDEHVRVTAWHCKDGARVEEEDVVVELETSKTNFDLTAERSGVIHYEVGEGAELAVGALLATIGATAERPPVWASNNAGAPATAADRIVTTKARKLMETHGLTADAFEGLNRITASDVLARIQSPVTKESAWKAPPIPAERVDIPWLKEHEIRLLSIASQGVVSSSVTMPVDAATVDKVIDTASQELGVGITRGEWVSYCVSRMLAHHRRFNGYFNMGAMILYGEQHIGYALNLGKGLKVPVIRKAEDKDLKSIVIAIKNFALQYMRDELTPADLSQPTFSVTDLGGVGVTHFLPVIPAGQSAILGVCAPPPGDPGFNLVLTFDHRMADGIEAAEFLQALRVSMIADYRD